MGTLLEVSLLLVFTYSFIYYYKYFTRPSPLPGPFPLPIIGNMLELLKTRGDFAILTINMHRKYGDMWEFYAFSDRQIWVSRTKFISKFFDKKLTKDLFFQRTANNLGIREIGADRHGLAFMRDYEKWRTNRKFLTQALMTAKFKKSVIPTIQTVFSDMEKMWLQLDHTKPIDLVKWMSHLTGDIIFRVSLYRDLKIMAEYFNTLVPDEKKIPELPPDQQFEAGFVELTRNSSPISMFLLVYPQWVRHYVPWFKQKNKRLIEYNREMYNRVETQIVRRRRNEIENTPMDQELSNDLLTQICILNTPRSEVKIEDANGQCKPMTDYEICRIFRDVFTGGTDTTAHSLCFLIYYICKHPRVKARLLKELETVFGSNFNQSVTYEMVDKLIYLNAVIKEVGRLRPIAHAPVRIASFETEVGGYIWPANTIFMADILNTNLHPEEWSDPEAFIPERWLDPDVESSKRDYAFGGGVRECPGRYLSEIELKVILTLLYTKFDIRLVNENEKLKSSSEFSVMRVSELKVFIKPKFDS